MTWFDMALYRVVFHDDQVTLPYWVSLYWADFGGSRDAAVATFAPLLAGAKAHTAPSPRLPTPAQRLASRLPRAAGVEKDVRAARWRRGGRRALSLASDYDCSIP